MRKRRLFIGRIRGGIGRRCEAELAAARRDDGRLSAQTIELFGAHRGLIGPCMMLLEGLLRLPVQAANRILDHR